MYKKRAYRKKRASSTRRKRVMRKSPLATKAYVRKAVVSKMESKQGNQTLTYNQNSEADYVRNAILAFITPGVTDKGRIGDSIYLTWFNVKVVFTVKALAVDCMPATLHMYLVKCKSGVNVPDDTFYRKYDNGAEDPYKPLDYTNIQAGNNTINTKQFSVLWHRQKTLLTALNNEPRKRVVCNWSYRFPKMTKCRFDSNDTGSAGITEITPGIFLYTFVYTGEGSRSEMQTNMEFDIDGIITTHYKD